jgi:hypothetical protein
MVAKSVFGARLTLFAPAQLRASSCCGTARGTIGTTNDRAQV